MSNFGELVKRMRKERGLTLEQVAKKIGSHKGYVSGIENDKVNPPSVKIIRKFAKLFGQDSRTLVRIAWADKAPSMIREEAQRLVALAESEGASSVDLARIPLLNTVSTGYASELSSEGRLRPAVEASVVIPRSRIGVDYAATVVDDSMELGSNGTPGYARGDLVLLQHDEKPRSGTVVYIVYSLRQRRQAALRQMMVEQGENVVLQPLNKEFPLEFLTHDDIDVVYRVVGRIEMFERTPVGVDA